MYGKKEESDRREKGKKEDGRKKVTHRQKEEIRHKD
jgi:hypothetical protein